jgi:hypothetical protein
MVLILDLTRRSYRRQTVVSWRKTGLVHALASVATCVRLSSHQLKLTDKEGRLRGIESLCDVWSVHANEPCNPDGGSPFMPFALNCITGPLVTVRGIALVGETLCECRALVSPYQCNPA